MWPGARRHAAGPGGAVLRAETDELKPVAKIPARIAQAYRQHVDYRGAAALRLWLSFLITFLLLRGLTYGIRYHVLPFHDIVAAGGLHIHHFVWGIFLLIAVGILLVMLDGPRWHPWLAIPLGMGSALVIDEFALWLNLKDVYWADAGRTSVDLAVVISALLALYWAAHCFWKQAVREIGEAAHLVMRGERGLLRRRARRVRKPPKSSS